ncbi:MAG: rod shape-determining protein MreC [Oscillospiraceae bacterium]
MRRFFKSKGFKVIIILLVVLLVGTIIAAVTRNGASPFSSATGAIFEPLQRATSYVGQGFKKLGSRLSSTSSYEKQIIDLQEQVGNYKKQLVDYEKNKQKIKLYEDFLQIKEEHSDFKVEPANVIGRDAANAFYSIVLNKGSADGIEKNDPVICGNGQLVGVVTKVGSTYCVVSTIFDPEVKISAYEVRTRETGFSTTSAELAREKLCRLSGLERNTAISTGGIVCTSGVGGIYPRDLIMGTVKEVKNDSHDISSYATITPGFNIKKLEDVLVITQFDGQGVSVSED